MGRVLRLVTANTVDVSGADVAIWMVHGGRERIRHRHSVANAGRRRSPPAVHFGPPGVGRFFVVRLFVVENT
jgi:hypothetical protein